MLQKKVIKERQEWTVTQMQNAGIMLTNEEKEKLEDKRMAWLHKIK